MKFKDKVNLMQVDDRGNTALHLAALHDHAQAAKILVSLKLVFNDI